MTLVRYSLGMAGNGDEAGRTGPEGEVWAAGMMAILRDLIGETVAVIIKDTPTTTADADRRARAITNVARAIKAVAAMTAPTRRGRAADETPEDEMSEDRDDDPELVAQVRAELVGRLDRLRANLEAKKMGGIADAAGDVDGSILAAVAEGVADADGSGAGGVAHGAGRVGAADDALA